MNNYDDYPPRTSIVDMAYEIIAMHEENMHLRRELEHYKEYEKKYMEELNSSINHSKNMIGSILSAALDEDSGLNKMFRAIERDPLKGEKQK